MIASHIQKLLEGNVGVMNSVDLKRQIDELTYWNTRLSERVIAMRRELARRRYTS